MLSRRFVAHLAVLIVACGLRATPSAATAVWGVQPVESSGYEQGHNATAVALDAQGNPRIAFYEGSGRNLCFAEKANGLWTVTVVDTTGDTGRWVSLEIDAQGNPHISYTYYLSPTDLPVLDLKYATRVGGTWTVTTVDATGDVGEYTSLALDAQGNPRISYYDNTNGNLKYARKSGGAWTVEPVESTGNVGAYSSLALDSQGNPHIAYQDLSAARVRYATKSGTTWTFETPSGALPVLATHTTLALDSQDRPHIAYYDQQQGKTKYANKPSTTWTNGVASALGADLRGSFLCIDVDSQDVPHLSFYDQFTGLVTYAAKNGGGGSYWLMQPVDEQGPQGPWTSLALDGGDFPHLSYHAPAVSQVRYAVFTDNTSDARTERPVAFMTLDAFPNPVRTSTQLVLQTPQTTALELLVLDARGRIVRNLGSRTLAPGATRTTWDGRDDWGQPVSAGVYFAVTRPADLAASRKLIVVR